MENWKRYAIYYTATGALAEFGAAWLGWDIATGGELAHQGFGQMDADEIARMTATPRRYGFHATLKPPFALASNSNETALRQDLAAIAARRPPVTVSGGLRLSMLDGFPALTCTAHPPLTALAAYLVRDLDRHRAPLSEADRARRNPDRLSPEQRANLDRWGYPWVMEQFRFHMTLGNRLPDPEAARVLETLRPRLVPLLPDPHVIDTVTLAGEDMQGRFHMIDRHALTG
ncbi:DUF1045 domain-containing protein [Paracoccus alkanivorans]|uniref:DUF1045 domain-containing protein n=1 Tax=Paracoccus alkanivorans TaxID=2116655 RepID=A0A3M0M645_9RHOB|nr:DUF1045 domain-containing protein [Paracoccus alkanivorans]RMC33252.1 DUF1045 domain-containing protein [Paracoccus alkanivorans]